MEQSFRAARLIEAESTRIPDPDRDPKPAAADQDREPADDDQGASGSSSVRSLAQREVHLGAFIATWKIAILIGFGILFRVAQYLANRHLWQDERMLSERITQPTLAGLYALHSQLAPPGFLFVEWLIVRFVHVYDNRWTLRLFPLICGIASLFLFAAVARRCLKSDAAWIAVALFAVCDELIYYASEVKQYSTDVAFALACLLMALSLASRPATRARLAGFAALGAVAVWFSHPAVFVLAGLGTVLIISALAQRDWKTAASLCLVSLVWVLSFAPEYLFSLGRLDHKEQMWKFWDFAFPPMPPTSVWDATWIPRRILYLFVNPLDFSTPLGITVSALPAFVLFVIGCVSMPRRDVRQFALLVAPGLFSLLAACLHLYPFHGRLVVFLVPVLLLLIAEGVSATSLAIPWRGTRTVLLILILLFPTFWAIFHLAEPRDRKSFNPHGDRRPLWLKPADFPY